MLHVQLLKVAINLPRVFTKKNHARLKNAVSLEPLICLVLMFASFLDLLNTIMKKIGLCVEFYSENRDLKVLHKRGMRQNTNFSKQISRKLESNSI